MAKFTLPDLPYDYNALEPYIDEETMKIHHDKHHQAYCDKLNVAVEAEGVMEESVEGILENVSKYSPGVRNNSGGLWNHTFFWDSMSPDGGEISENLRLAIEDSFGSLEEFKNKFSTVATSVFGSGWAWLGVKEGKLVIYGTPNQDNCYMDLVSEESTPLLALDVWEHAYYLKYQNKRPDYIDAFFKVINWSKVSERFEDAK